MLAPASPNRGTGTISIGSPRASSARTHSRVSDSASDRGCRAGQHACSLYDRTRFRRAPPYSPADHTGGRPGGRGDGSRRAGSQRCRAQDRHTGPRSLPQATQGHGSSKSRRSRMPAACGPDRRTARHSRRLWRKRRAVHAVPKVSVSQRRWGTSRTRSSSTSVLRTSSGQPTGRSSAAASAHR